MIWKSMFSRGVVLSKTNFPFPVDAFNRPFHSRFSDSFSNLNTIYYRLGVLHPEVLSKYISHSIILSWHSSNQSLAYDNNAERLTRKWWVSILNHWFDSTRVWTSKVRIPRSSRTRDGHSTHSANLSGLNIRMTYICTHIWYIYIYIQENFSKSTDHRIMGPITSLSGPLREMVGMRS